MTPTKSKYHVENVPTGARRKLRVVCIGAGYSGLMMAIIAEQKMKFQEIDFQIYDLNSDVGGTWLLNK